MENSLSVNDNISIFILPFTFDDEYYQSLENSLVWEKINLKNDNKRELRIDHKSFYPHIYDFLINNASVNDWKMQNLNQCILFSLKDKLEEGKNIAKLFGNIDLQIKIKDHETDKLTFRFLNEKSKLSSPKMVIYPISKVGILMLSIELTGKGRKLNDLLILNNKLHKIDQPIEIQIALPENAHQQRIDEANNIYRSLNGNDNSPQSFCMSSLLKFLLFNYEKNIYNVKLFNKSRFHLFTYFHVNTDEVFEDGTRITEEEWKKDLIRVACCQNKKYRVLPFDLKNNEKYMQIFANIYISSCVEGSCIMVDSPDVNQSFFSNFKDAVFLSRYVWIYLLVCLQRQTLIVLTKDLMDIDTKATPDSKEKMEKNVRKLAGMKINSYFTNISDYSQHNAFYWFCSDKLMIQKHLEEVKDKMDDVGFILRDENEQAEKKRNNNLQWILAILTLSQVFFAIVSLNIYHFDMNFWLMKQIPFIIILILFLYILYLIAEGKYHSSRYMQKISRDVFRALGSVVNRLVSKIKYWINKISRFNVW